MVNLNLMCDQPKVGGGRPDTTSPSPVIVLVPAQPVAAPSPPEVQEIPPEEATKKAPEASGKCLIETPFGQRKKAKVTGWHKSYCEGEKLKSRAAEGKKPAAPVKETLTPKARTKLVKELCSTRTGGDCRDYHIIRVCSQP
ncbi:hypothetical protein B296_00042657 [Ensete ventricosum]|uniref:Uncharacterized protein n=1 Tax=Ensete ventricosum TaxID=4639 RepID=A0A426ZHR7_ENSVE|nr:hypothetical protein B296_00042657 [Ensete ventricosum]